ncbi:hypothetical protein [Mesorhizobium sp.]|uniref:hypothetical protein n=1 Tax=Mesorhizobium sp. TaxID=1871066 RepID=UPI00120F0391|nr:hypothetical protein [Mesorhizobium sp.]TIL42782.1 MAG: hypothetical protein E5Y86_25610 [Mesorhizobium sp.]
MFVKAAIENDHFLERLHQVALWTPTIVGRGLKSGLLAAVVRHNVVDGDCFKRCMITVNKNRTKLSRAN